MSKGRTGITGIVLLSAVLLFSATAKAAELRTFTGHTGSVNAVAFSPDAAQVLTSSIYDPAKLWTTATGTNIRSFTPDSGVNSVAYSTDGTRVLTGSGGNTAKLWNAGTGALIRTFSKGTEEVLAVAFSPDGTKVLTGGDGYDTQAHSTYGAVNQWDAETGAAVSASKGHTLAVLSVAFSPDGTKLLSGSLDHTAKLWSAETGAELRSFSGVSGHTDAVTSVAFSADGSKVLTGSNDHTAKLWNLETGEFIRSFDMLSAVTSVAFSPDGGKVLTGSVDKTAKLWNAATGAGIRSLIGHTDSVNAVAFSADGTLALTGSSDHTAKLWAITVPVPYLINETQTVAGSILTSASLVAGTVTQECSNTVAAGLVISQVPAPGTQVDPGTAVSFAVSTGVCNVTVPNLPGLTQSAARDALAGANLVAGSVSEQCSNTVAVGLVISQYPPAEQQVPFGSAVAFVISSGLCNVVVPDVAGQTQSAAGDALVAVGLSTGTLTEQCSNTVAAGLVVSQNPAKDQLAPYGTAVTLVLSTGLCNVAVPNVTGLAQEAAGTVLTGVGLAVGGVTAQCSNTVAAGSVISQDPPADQLIPYGTAVALTVSTGLCNVTVPNLVGLTQTAAASALTGAGLVAGEVVQQCSNTVAAGNVINQFPAANQQAPFGSAVAMTVSTGLCIVTVPNVAGLTQTAAAAALTGANLTLGTVAQQCSDTVAAGTVISQNPAAEQQAPFGSVVTLTVSTGPCSVTVPNVAGLTQTAATSAITTANLAVGSVTRQCSDTLAAGSVIGQSPASAQQVLLGSAVALTVSTGPCPAEGEGENTTPTEAELRQLLTASFDAVDTGGDGQISYAEASAALAGLPQSVFNAVDTDGNGQISRAEAGLDSGGGCAGCSGGKSAFIPGTMKKVLGDMFLGGFSLMTLLAFEKHRP